jgi:hypothetical protein
VSSGWSVVLPDSLSANTRMQSASVMARVCLSRICLDVDTRARWVLMGLDELAGHWTLLDDERELVAGKRGPGHRLALILRERGHWARIEQTFDDRELGTG